MCTEMVLCVFQLKELLRIVQEVFPDFCLHGLLTEENTLIIFYRMLYHILLKNIKDYYTSSS